MRGYPVSMIFPSKPMARLRIGVLKRLEETSIVQLRASWISRSWYWGSNFGASMSRPIFFSMVPCHVCTITCPGRRSIQCGRCALVTM